MEPFRTIHGTAAPLDRAHVDTDQIIPKQFLKSIRRTGFGDNLFDGWRYLDEGSPEKTPNERTVNPEFVLNRPEHQGASVLLARDNFGCGSSREHAVWALLEYGFRSVIAPSFADIFHGNALKNGLLPVRLPPDVVDRLFAAVTADPSTRVSVDLEAQEVRFAGERVPFDMDPGRRRALLEGLDEIGEVLTQAESIRAYEARRREQAPWLFPDAPEEA